MKWVKVAIGAVIAIISIGIIATSVYDMTQEKVITSEVIFTVDSELDVYEPTSVYNDIMSLSVTDESNLVENVVIYLNNETYTVNYIYIDNDYLQIFTSNLGVEYTLYENGTTYNDGDLEGLDEFRLVFTNTQPPQLTGITATLILLTPLIFAGGVLAYLLNKQEL